MNGQIISTRTDKEIAGCDLPVLFASGDPDTALPAADDDGRRRKQESCRVWKVGLHIAACHDVQVKASFCLTLFCIFICVEAAEELPELKFCVYHKPRLKCILQTGPVIHNFSSM